MRTFFKELLISLPALLLTLVTLANRQWLFREETLFGNNLGPLMLVSCVASIIILLSQPWKQRRALIVGFRWSCLAGSTSCLLFGLICVIPWTRYQVIRVEALYGSLGISVGHGFEGLKRASYVTDESVGRYILTDPALLKKLMALHSADFLLRPLSSRLLGAALWQQKMAFDEVWQLEGAKPVLLSYLISEVNPHPWQGLEWAHKQLADSASVSLLKEGKARRILDDYFKNVDQLDLSALERLVFLATAFPDILTDQEMDELFRHWAKRFKGLKSVVGEGLAVRDQLKAFLAQEKDLVVEFSGLDKSDPKQSQAMRESVYSLLRSCGKTVQVQAKAKVLVRVSTVGLYQYDRPTYKDETSYETQVRIGRYGSSSQRVPKLRQVRTGSVRETQVAPQVELVLSVEGKTLRIPPTLFYWRDITYDHQNHRYTDVKGESAFGRMWPFGLDKTLFEFEPPGRYF